MVQSAIAVGIDLVSAFVLLTLVVAFGVEFVTGRPWFSRIWNRLAGLFLPLREVHWLLPTVAAAAILFVSDLALGALGTGMTTLAAWIAFALIGAATFLDNQIVSRYRRRRLRKHAAGGMGMPTSMSETNGVGFFDRLGHALALLPYSILLLGATRSGKTEAAKHIVQQMLLRFNTGVMVVFDYKTDYQDFFDALGIDYIKLSLRDSTHIPNLFDEFEDELDVNEFARGVFPGGDGRRDGGSAEHFNKVARQTFAAVLKMLRRKRDDPDNETVQRYFAHSSPEDVYNDLREHNDFAAATSALNVETNAEHAQDTYSTLQSTVEEVFLGDFARSPDEQAGERAFSFRDAYENPPGKPIVLDFPKNRGDSTKPLFRFYLDWAARFALDNPNRQDYFILDEFARIPNLRKIGDLLNVGAGDRVQVVVALQSVSQMYANYGRDRGKALLSGLVTKILLRANDSDTVEFIRESIGTEFVEYTKHVETSYSEIKEREVEVGRETKEEEEHRFSKGEIRKWSAGVGAIVLPDRWAKGYMPQLDAGLADLYQRAILGAESPPAVERRGGGVTASDSTADEQQRERQEQPADD